MFFIFLVLKNPWVNFTAHGIAKTAIKLCSRNERARCKRALTCRFLCSVYAAITEFCSRGTWVVYSSAPEIVVSPGTMCSFCIAAGYRYRYCAAVKTKIVCIGMLKTLKVISVGLVRKTTGENARSGVAFSIERPFVSYQRRFLDFEGSETSQFRLRFLCVLICIALPLTDCKWQQKLVKRVIIIYGLVFAFLIWQAYLRIRYKPPPTKPHYTAPLCPRAPKHSSYESPTLIEVCASTVTSPKWANAIGWNIYTQILLVSKKRCILRIQLITNYCAIDGNVTSRSGCAKHYDANKIDVTHSLEARWRRKTTIEQCERSVLCKTA